MASFFNQMGGILMTSNIIIFHRSPLNTQECLSNQQKFLEKYHKYFIPTKIVDYVSGDYRHVGEVSNLVSNQPYGSEVSIIMQSSLTQREYIRHYDLYPFFNGMSNMRLAELYLMDSDGNLYKKVDKVF
jgi:hypothetical protein